MSEYAKSRFLNWLAFSRPYLPFMVTYISWALTGMYLWPYVKISFVNDWVELASIIFFGLIPFVILPFAVTAPVITRLMWIIRSKKIHVKGLYFNVTRGPGKNVDKEIINAVKHPRFNNIIPALEIQDAGSVHQIGLKGPDEILAPPNCFHDDGIVVTVEGDASVYDIENLPDQIRDHYIRETTDDDGEKVTKYLRPGVVPGKSKIVLVLPAWNYVEKKWEGIGFDHNLIKFQQQTINDLREKLRIERVESKKKETPINVYERPRDETMVT